MLAQTFEDAIWDLAPPTRPPLPKLLERLVSKARPPLFVLRWLTPLKEGQPAPAVSVEGQDPREKVVSRFGSCGGRVMIFHPQKPLPGCLLPLQSGQQLVGADIATLPNIIACWPAADLKTDLSGRRPLHDEAWQAWSENCVREIHGLLLATIDRLPGALVNGPVSTILAQGVGAAARPLGLGAAAFLLTPWLVTGLPPFWQFELTMMAAGGGFLAGLAETLFGRSARRATERLTLECRAQSIAYLQNLAQAIREQNPRCFPEVTS